MEHANIDSFKGVNMSMKKKYGLFTYFIYFIILSITYRLTTLTLFFPYPDLTDSTVILIAAACALIVFWFIFFNYFVNQILNHQMEYGQIAVKRDLVDIKTIFNPKEGSQFWVVVVKDENSKKNKVIGTFALRKYPEDWRKHIDLPPENKLAFLEKMGVLSEYRGFGIANKLMDLSIEFAKKTGLRLYFVRGIRCESSSY